MILKMLEEGKISAEEATALLEALEESVDPASEEFEAGGETPGEGYAGRAHRAGRSRHGHRRSSHGPHHMSFHDFDREAFRDSMKELHRHLERIRLGAVEIGDEVSRQVQDAMETWREEWKRGGDRPFRHFIRDMGSVFHVPFGREMHQETFEEELETEPDPVVRVKALSGDVTVETWDQTAVKVEAVKKVWARTEEEARKRSGDYRISVERDGREVRIGARLADDAPGWLPARCTIDYTGPTRIYSTNGDIALAAVRAAELRVRSVNGDVDADLAELDPGEHVVSTVHGDIDLRLPADAELELHASTMHGEIACGFPGSVAGRSATRLHARLGRANRGAPDQAAAGQTADGLSGSQASAAGASGGVSRDATGPAGDTTPGDTDGGSTGGRITCELNVRAVFGDISVRPLEEESD